MAVPIRFLKIKDFCDIAEIEPLLSLVLDFCHAPDIASLNVSCSRINTSMAILLKRMRIEMIDKVLQKFPQPDRARDERIERYYQQYIKAYGRVNDGYDFDDKLVKITTLLFNATKLHDSAMVEMILAEPIVKDGQYTSSQLFKFFALDRDGQMYDDEQASGISLLHYATEMNAVKIIDLIVHSKMEVVNSKNFWEFTAFHVAAWNLNIEALEGLLTHSQEVNCQTKNFYGWQGGNASYMGLYPIHCALLGPIAGGKYDAITKEKSTTIIKMLLSQGADINALTGPLLFSQTPPYRQGNCREGSARGISGVSVLHLAVIARNVKAIKLLVDSGAKQMKLSLEGVPNYVKENQNIDDSMHENINDEIYGEVVSHDIGCTYYDELEPIGDFDDDDFSIEPEETPDVKAAKDDEDLALSTLFWSDEAMFTTPDGQIDLEKLYSSMAKNTKTECDSATVTDETCMNVPAAEKGIPENLFFSDSEEKHADKRPVLEAKNILYYSSKTSKSTDDLYPVLHAQNQSITQSFFGRHKKWVPRNRVQFNFPCRRFLYPMAMAIAATAEASVFSEMKISSAEDISSFLNDMKEISFYLKNSECLSLPVDTELIREGTESWSTCNCEEIANISIDSKFKSVGRFAFSPPPLITR